MIAASALNLLTILSVFTVVGLYVVAAWLTCRRAGGRALLILWASVSAAYGYLQYRQVCGQPLTCDVGGISPYFLGGTSYYFTHYVPVFTAIGLLALGAGTSVVYFRHRAGKVEGSFHRTVTLGTLAILGAWMVAMVATSELTSLLR